RYEGLHVTAGEVVPRLSPGLGRVDLADRRACSIANAALEAALVGFLRVRIGHLLQEVLQFGFTLCGRLGHLLLLLICACAEDRVGGVSCAPLRRSRLVTANWDVAQTAH